MSLADVGMILGFCPATTCAAIDGEVVSAMKSPTPCTTLMPKSVKIVAVLPPSERRTMA